MRINTPFTTPLRVYIPTYNTLHGVVKKVFTEKDSFIINASFKTYGGTETTNNDLYTIYDTASIDTWYDPRITSECRIKVLQTNNVYEILGNVENIDMRNQFLRFKVRAVLGGA